MRNNTLSQISYYLLPLLLVLCSCATAPQKPNAEAPPVVLSPLEIGDLKETDQPLCRITSFSLPYEEYGLMLQDVWFLNLRDKKTDHIVVEAVPDNIREEFLGKDFYLTVPIGQIEAKAREELDRIKPPGMEFSDGCFISTIQSAFRKPGN